MSNISALDRPDATTAVPPLPHEADRRRRLTVMRRWATGTLAAVSLLWLAVVLVQPSGDWVPYVLAALEASMVGALADWFAVVALFRRPLGLPIPHTAIVVARKEQFGRTLAAFFRGISSVDRRCGSACAPPAPWSARRHGWPIRNTRAPWSGTSSGAAPVCSTRPAMVSPTSWFGRRARSSRGRRSYR